MKPYPLVTIVVPCRNEARFIADFAKSLLELDYPSESLEIVIADGRSTDGTREVLQELVASQAQLRWIDNPSLTVPHGLNLAIQAARGEVIVRMDVHAKYPQDYLACLVPALLERKVDNIGVPWDTSPGGPSMQAHAVAAAQRSVFGIGLADYRLGVSEPIEVDTVPFGCFRRDVFEKIGMFDEDMHRNQDDEFNARMKKNGLRIVLLPGPKITYYARESIVKSARMMYQYGHFKPLVNRKVGTPATLRQFVPPVFVLALTAFAATAPFHPVGIVGLVGVMSAYIAASLAATVQFLFSESGIRRSAALLLPLTFFSNHVAYGAGYLRGVWDFQLLKKASQVPSSSR
ncbi:MAG: glycosyltransferase family 2 protein [Fibrobacteres bacterium]|nr:glycosyltransferase family 2 protein [Fibrobacterota bacterium]